MSNSTGFAPLPATGNASFPSPPVPQEEKVPKSPSGGPIRARSLLKDDDGRDEEYRIKLSVKCRNIPRKSAFSKRNYIVCAFGIDPETKETAYFDQTEQVKDDESPAFLKNVWVRYFPGRSDQQFRFHVYQKDADKKKLGAADCLGAAIVKLNEVYRDPGVEFHFALSSAKPASEKLLRAKKSAIVLRLEDKERIVRGESEKSDSQIDADPVMRETSGPEVLRAVEAMMSYGRPFVCHKEDSAPQEQCVFYRKYPGTIGLLYWCDPSCRDEDQNSYIVLDAITDIYVGKHFKCFPSRLADDRCFSLVARKQRVEIPTIRASIASGLVEETKEKTALPTPPMVMLQLGDAKSVRIDLEARTLKQRDSWACGLLAFLNRKQIQVNVHESVKGTSSSDHKQSGERVLVV